MALAFFIVFATAVVGICGYALWRGGAPERIVAVLLLLAWLASMAAEPWDANRFRGIMVATLAIDTILLLSLLAVALRANRFWVMAATSLQALIVLAHFVKMAQPELIRIVYMLMLTSWPALQLLLLAAGTSLHLRRIRRAGSDLSWSR